MITIKERYFIQGRMEEGDCYACGWPLYSGESAILTSDDEMFCCRGCAQKYIREMSEEEHNELQSS